MEPPLTLPACPKPKKVGVQLVLVRAVQIRCALEVSVRTEPLLHSTAMLSTRRSTQQYISDPQRLIWVVVCLKNIMRKRRQVSDIIDNNKNDTKRPKFSPWRPRYSRELQGAMYGKRCVRLPLASAMASRRAVSRFGCSACEELSRHGNRWVYSGSGARMAAAPSRPRTGCRSGPVSRRTCAMTYTRGRGRVFAPTRRLPVPVPAQTVPVITGGAPGRRLLYQLAFGGLLGHLPRAKGRILPRGFRVVDVVRQEAQ